MVIIEMKPGTLVIKRVINKDHNSSERLALYLFCYQLILCGILSFEHDRNHSLNQNAYEYWQEIINKIRPVDMLS